MQVAVVVVVVVCLNDSVLNKIISDRRVPAEKLWKMSVGLVN